MQRAFSRKNLWEALPPTARAVVGRGLALLPPAQILGRTFRATLRAARESDRWTLEQAREVQLTRVREICALAYERTAFYRRVFDACGFSPGDLKTLDDLARLPLIDKSTLRVHLEEMCTVAPGSNGVDEVSTGGSSGQPLKFYIGAGRSAFEYAYLVAGWERVGYRLKFPMAVFRGQVVGPDRAGFRHEYDPLLRRHYYSNFHMSDAEMRRYLEHVARLGPCYLLVYPSSAYALARFIAAGGHPPLKNVKAVLAGSETTYAGQREAVQAAFNARYFTWYGHSEKLVLSAECEQSIDQHVWPGYGYCELVDAEGRPITTPGVEGEIVGTGFINEVVPFIRYRTGDSAVYVGQRCDACGRNHLVVRDIQGHRTQEVLFAADGTEISWVALNMHDDTFDRVRQFQFTQTEPGRALLRLVPDVDFGAADEARIRTNLDRKFAGQIAITMERVNEIPLTPRGKTVYVDQRIPRAAPPSETPQS